MTKKSEHDRRCPVALRTAAFCTCGVVPPEEWASQISSQGPRGKIIAGKIDAGVVNVSKTIYPPSDAQVVDEIMRNVGLKPCAKYRRPKGVMGGACLTCGCSQAEHARAERVRV